MRHKRFLTVITAALTAVALILAAPAGVGFSPTGIATADGCSGGGGGDPGPTPGGRTSSGGGGSCKEAIRTALTAHKTAVATAVGQIKSGIQSQDRAQVKAGVGQIRTANKNLRTAIHGIVRGGGTDPDPPTPGG